MSIRVSPRIHVRVKDAMHTGILTTDSSTPLPVVARLMAERRVHAVAVADDGSHQRPWGIITPLDIAAVFGSDDDYAAGNVAAQEVLTVSAEDSLERAARVMSEHGATHLIVVDAASGHPVGVLSTLDVASVYAD